MSVEELIALHWFYNNTDYKYLTAEQLNIIRLLAHGVTDQQIARYLDIPADGVGLYLEPIFEKLKVDNRTQALAMAAKLGLI